MENLLKDSYFLKSFYVLGKEQTKCFNCSYCRARHNNIEELLSFDKLPTEINPHFDTIPVVVNVLYGDPLLYIDNTLEYLERLQNAHHKGPVIVITKGNLISLESKLKQYDLKIFICLSVFGNDKYDKQGSVENLSKNLEIAKRINEKFGYKYSIEYRPIINGINDSLPIMESIFKLANKYYVPIAYSGLQVDTDLKEYIERENLPFKPYDGYDFGLKKNISNEVEFRLRGLSVQYVVPIFKKTSCAISYLNRTRDYNAHYYRPFEVGCTTCPNKYVCEQFKLNNNKIKEEFSWLPFDLKLEWKENHVCNLYRTLQCKFPSNDCLHIKGWMLTTDKKLTTSDVRLIKWLTGFTVDAEFEELHYIQKDWIL